MSVGSLVRPSARFRPWTASQVVNQPRQHPGVLEQPLQPLIVARVDAVDQAFELALDDGQWGAQLVRDVGHQVASCLVLRVEFGGHRVEGARHVAHPARAVPSDHARAKVAAGDPVGGGDEVRHRHGDAPQDQRDEPAIAAHDDRAADTASRTSRARCHQRAARDDGPDQHPDAERRNTSRRAGATRERRSSCGCRRPCAAARFVWRPPGWATAGGAPARVGGHRGYSSETCSRRRTRSADIAGWRGSGSSLRRMFLTCASMARSNASTLDAAHGVEQLAAREDAARAGAPAWPAAGTRWRSRSIGSVAASTPQRAARRSSTSPTVN